MEIAQTFWILRRDLSIATLARKFLANFETDNDA